jgi:membrane protease YdiL (CAAX protease family)
MTTTPVATRAGTLLRDGERRPRRGFRLVGYLLMLMATMAGLAALGRSGTGANVAAHAAVAAVALGLTYVFRRRVDHRPWRGIGLPAPRWRETAAGFAGGTAAVLAVFAVLVSSGWARVTGTELAERGPGGVLGLLGTGLFLYATSAFVQELAFRGYALQTLADGWSVRGAAVVSSLIFALLHFTGVPSPLSGLVVLADLTLIAVFFVLTRLATGALWLAIGFHTAWNWVQDDVLSLDTDAGPDYGDALVHVRFDAPALWVDLLYLCTSAALCGGYWLLTRRRCSWEGR